MFYVYVLKSLKDYKYYIGQTKKLKERINKHNNGLVDSTRRRRPFILIYKESYSSRNEAYKREPQLKSYKGGEAFKKLLATRVTATPPWRGVPPKAGKS